MTVETKQIGTALLVRLTVGGIQSFNWIRGNGEPVDASDLANDDELQLFGRFVWSEIDAPVRSMTLEEVQAWRAA